MNKDIKIAIFVMFVIFSGIGFVFLTAASVRKGNKTGESTIFFTQPKNTNNEKKSFLDEDFKLELLYDFSTEPKIKKAIVAEPKTKIVLPEASVIPKKTIAEVKIASVPILDKKAPTTDEFDFLNPTSEKASNPIEKDIQNADIIKVENSKDVSIQTLDKSLETKTIEDTTYIVKEGDTLSIIAKTFYNDSKKHQLISDANKGLSSQNLKIGMKIRIPGTESQKNFEIIKKPLENLPMKDNTQSVVYKVKQGDTITSIAKKFFGENYSMNDIKKNNPGKDLSRLKIGESISMPNQTKKK